MDKDMWLVNRAAGKLKADGYDGTTRGGFEILSRCVMPDLMCRTFINNKLEIDTVISNMGDAKIN